MPRLLDEEYLSEEQPSGPSDETLPSETSGERKGGPDDGSPRNDKMAWTWKEYPWSIDLPIWLAPKPTNPGSRDHPNCRPCAFVFRLAGDFVRLRCANADTCEFCHDPSHPRYRGRHSRRKSRRMRTDRQLQDAMDQEEPADESASYDDSASHTRTSSNGKDNQVHQQDAHISLSTPQREEVLDLGRWNVSPVNEDCKLLLEWATEFGPIADEGMSTKGGDEKRVSASSKGFSSSTTFGSMND